MAITKVFQVSRCVQIRFCKTVCYLDLHKKKKENKTQRYTQIPILKQETVLSLVTTIKILLW